jgi:hypothetical protein
VRIKSALMGAAAALLLVAALGFASGVTPGQFAALSKRVTKLERSNRDLVGYVGGCLLDWQAITEYGDGENYGYVYDDDNNPSNGQMLVSALDFTDTGDQASGYVPLTTHTGCIGSAARLARTLNLQALSTAAAGHATVRRGGAYGSH